ncbi:MAG TPA: hypothetical protein VGG76_05780 [Gemmatimonadaceae bacterium]
MSLNPMQGSQGGNASPKTATTPQNPATTNNQDFGATIREAMRANANAELIAARAREAAAQAAAKQGVTTPIAPTAPPAPSIIIRGPNGTQTIVPPFAFNNMIPPQVKDISIAFFVTVAAIIIGLPLARAFARRMDRRGATPPVSNELAGQLAHLNQAIDAIALEVERISEGQRFTTRLLAEQRDAKLPTGTQR